jgi:biopolymer transport protein ExbD
MPAPELEEDSVDLTPMIDVVFLLLIFFMVTMKIVQEETELIVPLPASSQSSEPPEFPPTNIEIEIKFGGVVIADGLPMSDGPDDRNLTKLSQHLLRNGQTVMNDPNAKVIINIRPEGLARHKYTMNVLNSLTTANKELEKMYEQRGTPKEERRLLTTIMFQ